MIVQTEPRRTHLRSVDRQPTASKRVVWLAVADLASSQADRPS